MKLLEKFRMNFTRVISNIGLIDMTYYDQSILTQTIFKILFIHTIFSVKNIPKLF